jgi:hypothetical protein
MFKNFDPDLLDGLITVKGVVDGIDQGRLAATLKTMRGPFGWRLCRCPPKT